VSESPSVEMDVATLATVWFNIK